MHDPWSQKSIQACHLLLLCFHGSYLLGFSAFLFLSSIVTSVLFPLSQFSEKDLEDLTLQFGDKKNTHLVTPSSSHHQMCRTTSNTSARMLSPLPPVRGVPLLIYDAILFSVSFSLALLRTLLLHCYSLSGTIKYSVYWLILNSITIHGVKAD